MVIVWVFFCLVFAVVAWFACLGVLVLWFVGHAQDKREARKKQASA